MDHLELGKLIVFEGPDNVGKTTISRSVADAISQLRPCKYFSFPGNAQGSIGSLVYNIHHDKNSCGLKDIDANSLQALHIAAHIDSIQRDIIPSLTKGETVILDRFWWSSYVYGKITNCNMQIIENLINAEKAAWQGIHPDIIFYVENKFCNSQISNSGKLLLQEYQNLSLSQSEYENVKTIHNTDLAETTSGIKISIENLFESNFPNHQQACLFTFSTKRSPVANAPSPLKRLLEPTIVYDTYWEFAAKRQDVFFARLKGEPRPWTYDKIIDCHKFTNAYRASDRTSQFLIKDVIYEGSQDIEEVFFRIILFKIFNKIETWKLLQNELNKISFSTFTPSRYDEILTNSIEKGERIYSAAYIMPTGGRGSTHTRKHRMHLHLLDSMMKDRLPDKIAQAKSMGKVFELLKGYPSLGDFLAYQYATDINYSELTNFPETQFVVPGPGAKDGIKKCFAKSGGLSDSEIIKVVMEHQEEEFNRLGLNFKSLWGRPLMLIDCQNLFCETDKYARVKHPDIKGYTGRSRIKQKFHPDPRQINYWYPPKWGINERIQNGEMP
ncbi:nucleotide kinase domain-containing protein [Desulfovibrio sp.]|uniref:nucleotide kinase domain-containing protein n=1 Tax=Desulfovibrio sp. TaxID=885 RepID=UPI0025C4D870|nr:nucleotide kinase domain-containing protein [Desulfovibrio sp.]